MVNQILACAGSPYNEDLVNEFAAFAGERDQDRTSCLKFSVLRSLQQLAQEPPQWTLRGARQARRRRRRRAHVAANPQGDSVSGSEEGEAEEEAAAGEAPVDASSQEEEGQEDGIGDLPVQVRATFVHYQEGPQDRRATKSEPPWRGEPEGSEAGRTITHREQEDEEDQEAELAVRREAGHVKLLNRDQDLEAEELTKILKLKN
ncbi:unnamed protein product [Symbiodinium natans]|uniref:Uncharacterized protein n=1 Tax=Symbiodinium natans TaxID=878477 RepID=A0A812MLE4_9DINO|nr:unnamed protein product [Symbiodinium natans]